MTSEEINDIAGFIVALAAIPATATALIYGFGSPWWRSWLGRVMFAKWLSVALVLIVVFARRTWGDYPGYEWVALFTYSFMLVTFTATTIEIITVRRGADDGSIIPREKEKFMGESTGTLVVPDIWYKAQRVLRTVVAFLITAVPTVNLAAMAVIDYLQNQQDVAVPGWVFLWLNVIVAGTALVIGLVTRLMAVPGVNAWLTKIGLGSVPRDSLEQVSTAQGQQVTVVAPDPKAETGPAGPVG